MAYDRPPGATEKPQCEGRLIRRGLFDVIDPLEGTVHHGQVGGRRP
jgi:hypothetical protein